MEITPEILTHSFGEAEVQAVYQVVKQEGDWVGFAKRFAFHEDGKVARNALWVLTKATDKELLVFRPMLHELIDLAMKTGHSAVRRLSLNLVERLPMNEEDLRTDFLDFCLQHAMDVEELPGIQSLCMKLAYRMCKFHPELMDELRRTLEGMEISYYKPAVKCVRNRILSGRLK